MPIEKGSAGRFVRLSIPAMRNALVVLVLGVVFYGCALNPFQNVAAASPGQATAVRQNVTLTTTSPLSVANIGANVTDEPLASLIPSSLWPGRQSAGKAAVFYAGSELLLHQGEAAQATEYMLQALALDNSSAFLWTQLAHLHWAQGEEELAEEALRQARIRGNETEEMLVLDGMLNVHRKNFPQAQELFRRALSFNGGNVRVLELLACLYAEDGAYDMAIDTIDKAIAVTPGNMDALHFRSRCFAAKRDFARAIADLETVIAKIPEESIFREMGELYRAKGDFAGETAVCLRGLQRHPDSCLLQQALVAGMFHNGLFAEGERYLWRGEGEEIRCKELEEPLIFLYLKEKKLTKALQIIDSLIRGGKSDKGHYLQGLTQEKAGNSTAAAQSYAAIASNSSFFGPARLREAVLLAPAAPKIAIQRLESLLPVDNMPEAYLLLAELHEATGNDTRAQEVLKIASDIYPNNTDALYAWGFFLGKQGSHDEALAVMRRTISLDAGHCAALNFIGYHYAERGIDLANAQSLIEAALRSCPGNVQILDSLGWVLSQQRRYEEATKYLQDAHNVLPYDRDIAQHLAETYKKRGMFQEALAVYHKLGEKYPGDKAIAEKIRSVKAELAPAKSAKRVVPSPSKPKNKQTKSRATLGKKRPLPRII